MGRWASQAYFPVPGAHLDGCEVRIKGGEQGPGGGTAHGAAGRIGTLPRRGPCAFRDQVLVKACRIVSILKAKWSSETPPKDENSDPPLERESLRSKD